MRKKGPLLQEVMRFCWASWMFSLATIEVRGSVKALGALLLPEGGSSVKGCWMPYVTTIHVLY